jgi:hypothetical protein
LEIHFESWIRKEQIAMRSVPIAMHVEGGHHTRRRAFNERFHAAIADLVRDAGTAQGAVRAAGIVERLRPLVRDLFIESNPVPVKTALARTGLIGNELRAPLAPLRPENLKVLEASLKAFASHPNI